MGIPYAEVIGDPISHSKSPLIHKFWLEKLGLEGDYRTCRVSEGELPSYLAARMQDADWRGSNVTAPLKEAAARFAANPHPPCGFVNAVNCLMRVERPRLEGWNTDVDGIAEALSGVDLDGQIVCLIGAGGAARAMLCHLLEGGAACISIVVRDLAKGKRLARAAGWRARGRIRVQSFDQSLAATCGARLIVNATPMGMTGGPRMHPEMIDSLGMDAFPGVTVFDMVYAPAETELLATARGWGAETRNGFPMLIGQAATAFTHFFGATAPREHDAELKELLTS
jgi:shikimate dehydrogenase